MSKGNALTALKVKVKGLETDLAGKEQELFEARQAVAKARAGFDAVVEEGKVALYGARQAVEDLRSVNAELRDAVQETQDKRDQYKRWLKWTAAGFAAYVVLDTAFYIFLIWG